MTFIDNSKYQQFVALGLRLALAASFISAVADRFGGWGVLGETDVSWGNFEAFLSYTKILNPWAPKFLVPLIGWTATILETGLALLLLANVRLRETSFFSGVLLFLFAFSMTVNSGFKAPLDYSVYSASFAAFA